MSANPWEPGRVIRGYTLLAAIAKGGMGEIWLARQSGPQGFERMVVIKRILQDEEGAHLEHMLLDEARIAAQLNHPNIVQVYELGEFDASYFIAMEYLHGENLASVVRRGLKLGAPLPVACAARIAVQVAEALSYAHAKKGLDSLPLGLVHRDVSPQNVIVTYDGHVKLVDFGIAKAKAAGRMNTTGVGMVKGKFAYMSPEQARGEPLDGRSDIFSLGIVLFEVLAQSRFYGTRDEVLALQMLAKGDAMPRLNERAPHVPPALVQIVHRALERPRDARYATARDMAVELEAWLKTTSDGSTAELETWLKRAFEDRITQRELLIASARRPGPVLANDVIVRSDRSLHAQSAFGSGEITRPQPRREGLAVAGAAALTVGLGLVLLFGRPTAREPEAPAPQPAASSVDAQMAAQPVSVEVAEARSSLWATIAPPKKVVAAKGTLSLDTTPWTRVSLGKTHLGDTPLVGFPMPAGRHKLRLRNPEKGIDRTVEVEVPPGKNTGMRLKL